MLKILSAYHCKYATTTAAAVVVMFVDCDCCCEKRFLSLPVLSASRDDVN
jgi:hypothetical protein